MQTTDIKTRLMVSQNNRKWIQLKMYWSNKGLGDENIITSPSLDYFFLF